MDDVGGVRPRPADDDLLRLRLPRLLFGLSAGELDLDLSPGDKDRCFEESLLGEIECRLEECRLRDGDSDRRCLELSDFGDLLRLRFGLVECLEGERENERDCNKTE